MTQLLSSTDIFSVLVSSQQIQHPTASLIAKVATAQDDITGDGTTSNVLIIGELLKQADLYVSEVKEKRGLLLKRFSHRPAWLYINYDVRQYCSLEVIFT